METIKDTQKNITEIYQEQSYDELTSALNEYLNGSSEEGEESSESESNENTKTFDAKETSDAFDDLFNS
jgi:hypothetical protein